MKHIKKLLALALVAMTVLAVAIPAMAANTTINNVNVRQGPGTSYSKVGTLSTGDYFSICFLAKGAKYNGTNNWYCITWIGNNGAKEGYMHESFINSTSFAYRIPQTKVEAFGFDNEILKYGSKGIHVYNMQLVLYKNGYLKGDRTTVCDGVYGAKTLEALESFQNDKLEITDPVDGLAGGVTKSYLWSYRGDILEKYGATIANG